MIYDDEAVCRKNLKRAANELDRAREKYAAYIYELTGSVLPEDGIDGIPGAAALFDRLSSCALPDGADGVYGRVILCSEIRRRYGIGGAVSGYIGRPGRTAERPGSISYFRSPATDQAFDIFASRIESPSVLYGGDFSAVCENVYYGRTQFCILPTASSADGRLSGFYALAEKYELTGTDECRVQYGDGETVLTLFTAGVLTHENDDRIRVRIRTPHDPETLTRVLCAASYLSVRCTENDSLPTGYGTSDMLTFAGERGLISDLLFFLYCERTDFDITGVFGYENV